ncbi:putative membrane protein [Candidatus Protofrankia californiensis]|uniref:Putative membrane protein n=1 Tax=Candidatus Protofrankia californiensis TaxID=1839754 RepID=A0A1C3NVK9_9ACTN|nr:putative membrane protein [Candidatus Protofrankia californiensis]
MISAFEPLTAASVGLPATRAVAAAIPLFLVALLMWRRMLPRLAVCLALTAGATLTSGWLHTAITAAVGWATDLFNWATRSTVGGVVPGAVALLLTLYLVLALAPSSRTLDQLRGETTRGAYDRRDRRRDASGRDRYDRRRRRPAARPPRWPDRPGTGVGADAEPAAEDGGGHGRAGAAAGRRHDPR